MELSLSRPNTGYTARTQRRGELVLHAAEVCTEQYVHFALRIVVCVSFQFSSRCSKVKGDSSDPERLGKMVKHCFLQEFSLIRFICLREKSPSSFI